MYENDHVGKQIGAYRLLSILGRGGFSTVYLGEHSQSHTQAAIKILQTHLEVGDIEQFRTQARSIVQLKHPHIVDVFDAGLEGSLPYTVMTYAPHGTLRQRHPRGSRLPIETVLTYIKPLSEALQYVHNQGLIHRDIKPHNILIGPQNEILLSDFGIAIVSQSIDQMYPASQNFEGTVVYAAPEQLQGRPHRSSDQYALGIVIYEWLTGEWPFQGTFTEIASQHMFATPPSLREKNAAIPAEVERIILRALEKFPHKRYPSVQEFTRALELAMLPDNELTSTGTLAAIAKRQFMNPLPFLAKAASAEKPSLPQGTTLLTYRGHLERIHALAWAPDGSRIASSSLDETIQVWDASTGETRLRRQGQPLSPQALAWSPDSSMLAITGDLRNDTVELLSSYTTNGMEGRETQSYNGHQDVVQAIAWSPDGSLVASASDDMTVQLWKPTTTRRIFTYRGHSQGVQAICWSPDSKRLASGGKDASVQFWNLNGSGLLIAYGHRKEITALRWSPNGSLVASASNDGTIKIWDAATIELKLTYDKHSEAVTALSWSPDSRLIVSSSFDRTAHVWDVTTGETQLVYRNHDAPVSCADWSPDGSRIASSGNDLTIQVWQAPA